MSIKQVVPLCVSVALVAGGACVWRSGGGVQPSPVLSVAELRARAGVAQAAVRAASNRVDLAGRAIENAIAIRGEAEAAFLSALSARDASGLGLLARRVEYSHSDVADAFRLAGRLVDGCQRLAGSSATLRTVMRDVGEDASLKEVSRSDRERLQRALLDVDVTVRDVNAIADEIKARWLIRGGEAPVSSSQPLPVGNVERELTGRSGP